MTKPQDPNLYGQRPPKRQKHSAALPSSLAFSSSLASLISSSKAAAPPSSSLPAAQQAARPRPSKTKPDIFAGVKAKKHSREDRDRDRDRDNDRLVLKEPAGTEEEKNELASARRKMEDKARLYAAMKRGDYVPKEGEAAPLVDFDRKWAEAQGNGAASSSDSEDDQDSDNNDTEVITYTDEFGRTRTGTRAERARMERRLRAQEYTATEIERMSARPKAPTSLIHGDVIQSEAFVAHDADAMEAIARKRDRSLTPPDMKHYDARAEIRTKGVGFFQFSRDEETRQKEMESLAAERERTERERESRKDEREARRKEVEERRRLIEERRLEKGEKRALKMAENFLEGLAGELGGGKEEGGDG